MDETSKKRIEDLINSKKIFLFMKGTPEMPECGFSKKVVDVLTELKVDFDSFNVLEDEDIRQGVKDFANWPTIPQLYINGKFVGGCDIIEQMNGRGELQKILN